LLPCDRTVSGALETGCCGYHPAVAAISPGKRHTDPLPRWAGTLGMLLGSAAGAAACYVLATLL
jgi:hypothetical protein